MLRLATILLIIGGLNWLLVGLFDYNLVGAIFGGPLSTVSRIIYVLVGLSALYDLFAFRKIARGDRTISAVPPSRGNRAA